MATAGDGNPPYQSTGAGGKVRKNQSRRNFKTTPYDRPIINNKKIQNPSLITKIVNPASRLIYAGANKLFGAFRNRLLPSEINEEPKNVLQASEKSENSASIAAATGISELEQMLQQKTFTRTEIQRLTALLHSRTTELPSDDVVERDGAKPHSSPSRILRLEASTSGSQKRHVDERDNFYAGISTPAVTSKALEDEMASPAELAKAYMGSRPIASSAMKQDMKFLTDASGLPKTPISSFASKTTMNGFKGLENGFVTPRSRGRSAMYSMARAPYARSSTFTLKGIGSNYSHGATLTSQSTFGQEGKMAIKRRSSVLDDDIGSGGPLRRTRQKANLLSRDKRELGYTPFQQSDTTGQKLLLMSGSEPEDLQRAKLNGDTSMHGSGYALVPTKSTQTATKILQHLEKPSPKENKSGSAESPTKLTLDMLHGKALRSLEKVEIPKSLNYPHDSEKSEAPHQAKIHTSREPASKGKDKIEENGYRHDRRESSFKGKEKIEENGTSKFPSPRSIYNSTNGEVPVPLKDNAPNVTNSHSPLKVPSESPQKKRAFQMSAPDDSFEIDDDDEVHVNGPVSFPLVESEKPETSLVANKLDVADSIESPKLTEAPKTPALLVNNESVSAEVPKFPEQAELKEVENATSLKTNFGVFIEPGRGMKLPPSPPSTTSTQTSALLQTNLQTEKVASEKSSSPSPFLFGTTVEKVSPSQLSVKEPTVFKLDATSDLKAPESNSAISSVPKNDHVKFSASNKEDNGNGNDQNIANSLGTSELKSSAVPLATSTNNIFSFGKPTNTTSTPNTTSASNAPAFPSINGTFSFGNPANNASNAASASSAPALASVPVQTAGTNTNSFFNNISPNVVSASTSTPISTTTATAATTNFFSTSASLPVFSFGSTATPTSMAETGNNNNATNDKELRSNTSSLPSTTTSFATTTTTGSGYFGFSSPAVASTTTAPSQGSFFSVTNGSQANTSASTAVTKSGPFHFGSPASFAASTPAFGASATPAFGASATPAFGTSASAFGASATPAFGASTPAFGASAPAFGSSAPAFGSSAPAFGSSASFGLMAASSEGKSSNTTSVSTTSIFGSTWQAPPSSGSGSTLGSSPSSTVFSFGASSTPMPSTTTSPIVFGASNTAASFMTTGATNSSFSGPSVFGNSAPVFGAATLSPNNNDQMSMEDSMAEDSMHTPSSISPFGQAPVSAPGFMFGSSTPTPTPTANTFQFAGQPNQTPQIPFQSSSVEFNAGGGSFSLGSAGDKSQRRMVRVKTKNRRKGQ
uniref:nuclear pore complex protein NUP1 isoform X2 n=1 Tax=Erigeron canadensis TaxID=72917 RepID=UPI001CB8A498|nr:nuclear pore complex protein NUP1 isoform X2 [Erigeron canadensis]